MWEHDFSLTWKGPVHSAWNLECFPFSSWALSHFRTRSPTSKFLFPADFLSNHLLIRLWWMAKFSWVFCLSSSNFSRLSIWVYKVGHWVPWNSWDNWRAGRDKWGGRTASFPYTRKYGEVPSEGLGMTRPAQRALWRALCRLRWWDRRVFLMMQIIFLLVDSANPFPWE